MAKVYARINGKAVSFKSSSGRTEAAAAYPELEVVNVTPRDVANEQLVTWAKFLAEHESATQQPQDAAQDGQTVTIQEAAKLTSYEASHLVRMARTGRIKGAVKQDGKWLLLKSALPVKRQKLG